MIPRKIRIALLGATSHIAKSLLARFVYHDDYSLHLYARVPESARDFMATFPSNSTYGIKDNYAELSTHTYDAVINCVGVGTHHKLRGEYSRYFTVTEEYDNLAIRYLTDCNPDALYISFSSGAVYGRSFSEPVTKESENCLRVNHIAPQDYYAIARLNAETKHRSFHKLNIVDLRLFSYFSRFIDLADGYFITDVVKSILQQTVLETGGINIVRDYVHPDDLFTLVLKFLAAGKINTAQDVSSTKPVAKQEILDYFTTAYGLRYEVNRSRDDLSPTGSKQFYCSAQRVVPAVDFRPRFSSLETLIQEAAVILKSTTV